MTDGDVGRSPTSTEPTSAHSLRVTALIVSIVLLVVMVVPPISTLARRYEYVEGLQYVVLAALIPALFVFGAPWRHFGIARLSLEQIRDGVDLDRSSLGPVDRWAAGRRRHRGVTRAIAVLVTYIAVAGFWRTPPAVDALAHHWWLVFLEVLTLTGVATWLWTELIDSSPLAPRLVRPHRIVIGAVAMWTVWILAYFVALSHSAWYTAYTHRAGSGVSLVADQQLTSGIMWVISGAVYISFCFWNLFKWLQSEDDPNDELHHLMQIERIRRGAGKPSGLFMNERSSAS